MENEVNNIEEDNILRKGYKYRIYPNKEQIEIFEKHFFADRIIYNSLLSLQENTLFLLLSSGLTIQETKKYLKEHNLYYNAFEASKFVRTELRKQYEVLKEINSTLIDKTCAFLGQAFDKLKKTKIGFPNYKSKYDKNKSFCISIKKDSKTNFKQKNKKWYLVDIPSGKLKMENILMSKHRDFPDNAIIKNITISKTNSNQYYISFGIEFIKNKKSVQHEIKYLGIDRNVKHNVICTSEEKINEENQELFGNDVNLKKFYEELKNIQKKYAKIRENLLIKYFGENKQNKKISEEQKSSKLKFYEKQIAKINLKIKNYRTNKNWNIANTLISQAEVLVFEDLKVKNMSKKAKNNGKKDGSIKRKKVLNREILNASWYDIKLKTETKAIEKNVQIFEVAPHNTSIRCNKCGFIHKDNRLTQEKFKCVSLECGHEDNADNNSSKNIRDKHLRLW